MGSQSNNKNKLCPASVFSFTTLPACPFLHSLPIGIVVQDKEGQIVTANPMAEKILGQSLEEMRGKTSNDPTWQAIHEDGTPFPGSEHPAIRTLKSKKEIFGVRMGVYHAQKKSYTWIEINAVPFFDVDGNLEGVYTTFSDVTELVKQKNYALEGWLALDTVKDMVTVVDREHCYRLVNDSYLDNHGLKLDNVIGRHVRDILGEQVYEPYIRRQLEECFSTGKIVSFKYKRNFPYLGERYLQFHYYPYHQEGQEEISRAICTVSDLSDELKFAEQAQKNEEYLRSIIETTADGFWVIDIEGRFIDVNQAYCRMSGYTRDELLTMRIHDTDTHESLALAETRFKLVASSGYEQFVVYHRHKNGSVFPLEISATYTGNKENSFICFGRDIKERVADQIELLGWQKRFKTVIEHMKSGVAILDKELCYLFASQRYQLNHGIDGQILFGRSYHEVFPNQSEQWKKMFANVLAGSTASGEENFDLPNGQTIKLNWECRPLYEADGSIGGLVLYSEDVTTKRRVAAERRRLEAQLRNEQKLSSLGTMAGGVAHEINNPLMGIINLAQLILDRSPEDHENLKDYANEIIVEGERIAGIVSSLLDFSRRDDGQSVLIEPSELFNRVLSLSETILSKEDIVLEKEIQNDLPEIKCKPSQIQQILLNLITNARDATLERFPKANPEKIIKIAIKTRELNGKKYIRFLVKDSGYGVPFEYGNKIFEPFFSTKPQGAGTGIGLSISYGIAKSHGGELSFERPAGGGSAFYLDLPVPVSSHNVPV